MKKILLIMLLTLTACTSEPKEASSFNFYELSKNIIEVIQDSVKDYIETPLEEDLKYSEEEYSNDSNSPQNGFNEVTQPSKGISGSSNGSSSTSNNSSGSSSNNSTNTVRTCPADNPYKYFYTNEQGEFAECPGIYDPVPEEKPNYVCEFGIIDKMQPCNYTRPEETGPFGVFATPDEAFADAHARGYETGQYSNSFTFDNMGIQVWTYFPL